MVGSRWLTATAGLVVSLLLSAAAWYYFETFLLFLFVPFVPFLLRGRTDSGAANGDDSTVRSVRRCPACGFRTANSDFEYCPRDGSRLE